MKKNVFNKTKTLYELPPLVDYLKLEHLFRQTHKNPKKKIFDLIQNQSLESVRKGFYYNHHSQDQNKFPKEVLANQLYYPSYVSLEWALSYYGLIPERVYTVTSVTIKKSWVFEGSFGRFEYVHLNKNYYPQGYALSEDSLFWIATPEKALLDFIGIRLKKVNWKSFTEFRNFLESDLRIDYTELMKTIHIKNLLKLRDTYHQNSKEYRVIQWIRGHQV